MKYYYKSPEELARAHQSESSNKPRNRGRLILVLDLVVLLLVFGILMYKGGLLRKDAPSKQTLRIHGLQLSASLPSTDGQQVRVYLHQQNTTALPFAFPGPASLAVDRIELEFIRDGRLLQRCLPEVPSSAIILPGAVHDSVLSCERPTPGITEITMRLYSAKQQYLLRFPEVTFAAPSN